MAKVDELRNKLSQIKKPEDLQNWKEEFDNASKILSSDAREELTFAYAVESSKIEEHLKVTGQVRPNDTQIGEPITLTQLADSLANESAQQVFRSIQDQFAGFRTVRGDGNCYYRAVMYGLLEQAVANPINSDREHERIVQLNALGNRIDAFLDQALASDFASLPKFNLEPVVAFREKLQSCLDHRCWNSVSELEQDMRSPDSDTDMQLVFTARMMIALQIYNNQTYQDIYSAAFNISGKDYIDSILTFGTDIEGIAVEEMVLCKALEINGTINLIADQGNHKFRYTQFENNEGKWTSLPDVNVLLRPGHYDLLYTPAQLDLVKSPPKEDFKERYQSVSKMDECDFMVEQFVDSIKEQIINLQTQPLHQTLNTLAEYILENYEDPFARCLEVSSVLSDWKSELINNKTYPEGSTFYQRLDEQIAELQAKAVGMIQLDVGSENQFNP